MEASREMLMPEEEKDASRLGESAPACRVPTDGSIDSSLLADSLAKTPWERMQSNDDALRFADSLRAAMEKRNAKP